MKNYKYGFKSFFKSKYLKGGLNKNLIYNISKKNKETYFINKFRKKSLNVLSFLKQPDWCFFDLPIINYNKLFYYSSIIKKNTDDNKINKILDKLNLTNKNKNTSVIDLIFDSNSIYYTMKDFLEKQGIIYLSLFKAINVYYKIINFYLSSVIFINDNFFSAVNSIIFSEGSFCYIPKETFCIFELTTYFRTNTENFAQFERTLIILNKNSYLFYLEGCTAPLFKESQLHVAIVELIVNKKSKLYYCTIQNWYRGSNFGEGGLYNITTKRGICMEKAFLKWVQIEIGSFITWKYPSTLLVGKNSISEFYSISFLSNLQQADTGCKMYHISPFTKSKVISKSISLNYSTNTYRGMVDIKPLAYKSVNNTECSSLIIGYNSLTNTIPYLKNSNYKSYIEQETFIFKINILQLFLFLQRCINIKTALNMIIFNFCENIYLYLPTEFSVEISYLIFLRTEECIF